MVDESGRIAGDLLCIHCGYNLRTMHESAVCPECGGDVRASIKCCLSVAGEWLGKTATSVKAFAGMLAVEAGLIGVVLLGAIGGPEVLAEAGLISGLIGLFLLLILVLALIMMTPRDPRLRGVREGLSARRGIRLLMLVSLVGLPFSPGSLYLPEGLTLRSALPEVGLSEAVELAGGLVALLPLAILIK